MPTTEDTALISLALAYVDELYRELTQENGVPIVGIQNQAVEFILADPQLREAVRSWGETADITRATTTFPPRPPIDAAYRRVRAYLQSIIPRVFAQTARD